MPIPLSLGPLTSTLRQAPLVRIAVEPSRRNGLRKPSQLMLEPDVLVDLDLALRGWLELP